MFEVFPSSRPILSPTPSLSEKSRHIVDLSGVVGAEVQERVLLVLRRCLVSCEDVEEALLLIGLCITQGGWGRRFKGN